MSLPNLHRIVRMAALVLLVARMALPALAQADNEEATISTTGPRDTIEIDPRDQVFVSDYMGQELPGLDPVIFAPGFISTERAEVAFEMSPDGQEVYFVRFFSNSPRILFTRRTADGWTTPALVQFAGDHFSSHPSFSPDGTTLYYSSRRPLPADWPGVRPAPDSREATKVWRVVRGEAGWSQPQPVFIPGGDVIADASVSASGTLYASGILRSEIEGGRYSEPEELTPHLEGHWPYVAPDESFIVYGHGYPRKLLLSFQLADRTWTAPQSCSDGFGFEGAEMNGMPFVTPDGKYLFFTARHDIYWVSAEVITRLAPTERQ